LTFDTEDFISENSVKSLHDILEFLKKRELKALFFITGNMAEKLIDFPATVDLLNEHQIGYHTSSHSIHPTLFEFTDIESYEQAIQNSLIRETSHINPLTGEIEGLGGIHALERFKSRKKIVAFRAPGYCWTPPHLEAMKNLGITFDFSTHLSIDPVKYNGITFYPFTILTDWKGGIREQYYLQRITLKRATSVLTIHPSTLVNRLDWDLIYYSKNNLLPLNPAVLTSPPSRTPSEIQSKYQKFDLLLRHIVALQKLHILEITPLLHEANKNLSIQTVDIDRCYKASIKWAEGFGYKPKYLYSHFLKFFEDSS
jgi:hypothetical protein